MSQGEIERESQKELELNENENPTYAIKMIPKVTFIDSSQWPRLSSQKTRKRWTSKTQSKQKKQSHKDQLSLTLLQKSLPLPKKLNFKVTYVQPKVALKSNVLQYYIHLNPVVPLLVIYAMEMILLMKQTR